MIELRWIERPLVEIVEPLPKGIVASVPMVRVLQFRTYKGAGSPVPPYSDNWTEWQDVPTVGDAPGSSKEGE